ncbi:MAG: ATP-dependent DNA helicase RecG [Chloroflexi bacterium]|nr:ATP-dependent DNA helicase RecG [Chloroflexota bacterium]
MLPQHQGALAIAAARKAPRQRQGLASGSGPVQRQARDRTPAFLRVLKLEESRGFNDGAVFGGLDAFLARWQAEEKDNPGLACLAQAGLLPVNYRSRSPQARAEWSARAVAALQPSPQPEALPQPPSPSRVPLSHGERGTEGPGGHPQTPVSEGATPAPFTGQARSTATIKAAREGGAREGSPKGASLKDRGERPERRDAASPDTPITALHSVRGRSASLLGKLGVQTLRDLAYLFPRRHNPVRTIAQLRPEEEQTVVATLRDVHPAYLGPTMQGTEATASDDTGRIHVVWFNQRRLAQWLKPGVRYVFTGRVSFFRDGLVLESPEQEEVRPGSGLEEALKEGQLYPVYPSTEGLYQPALRRMVREALARCADAIQDALPEDLRRRNGLLPLRQALWEAHYPQGPEGYEAARRRLAFEELFLIQLGVLAQRKTAELGAKGLVLQPPAGFLDAFFAALPFGLTPAQERVLAELLADMARGDRPMSRLLQGEVGSGKTVVALAALLTAAACGYQGAIMAPTEVLAEQHFITVGRLLERERPLWGLLESKRAARPLATDNLLTVYLDPHPRPIMLGLLTGSASPRQKRAVQKLLADGTLDILIGTHAIIQEEVRIPRLALAVVDEQHRFGVAQRAALRRQGLSPHLLVMSATPIPRTLALTLYGDLDLSTIDQLPPGRQKVRTRLVSPERRSSVYDFVRKEVASGRQCFIIYPLIDESEAVNARAAVAESERLCREVFPDLRLGLLHGRMGIREKQGVMEAFRKGEVDVLVSTPVVEVGIDVPNATVMVVEGADRFGLAQLHQFRGRVGRGEHPSYCVLIAGALSAEGKERLSALERLDDGFQLAEVDLQMRGPGDYFGTRQSGLPDLRMARLSDTELLALARQEASALLEADPQLALSEHAALKGALARFGAPGGGETG